MILAKTVKGYGMGHAGEGQNITHQQKKLDDEALKAFRDRFNIPVSDEEIAHVAVLPAGRGQRGDASTCTSGARRSAATCRQRRASAPPLAVPALEAFEPLLEASGRREISTTMAFVRISAILVKDKNIGTHIVPIVPDEARTFGMEGMFRQVGIYSSMGQLYTPQDADQLLYYKRGQEGPDPRGRHQRRRARCAAGSPRARRTRTTASTWCRSTSSTRCSASSAIGDFCWAAGDMRARGFLIGGTAGRTTLAGEGLQHQDGHSQLVATTIPNCVAYDPRFAYELAVIMQDGLRRMFAGAGDGLLLHHLHERELRAPGDAEGRRGRDPARACICCTSAARARCA